MVATGLPGSIVEIVDLLSTSTHCQNFPNFPRSTHGVNGELHNQEIPLVCGGGPATHECNLFVNGSWVSSQPMTDSRYLSSVIKSPFADDSRSLFVTGSFYPLLNSADVFVNEKWEVGPILPLHIGDHCMAMINSTALMLIGGMQDNVVHSTSTHILDTNSLQWIAGPELKFGRRSHRCARIPSNKHSSEYSIIVVGGFNNNEMSSVEILDEGSNEWRRGPELPFPICCSALVEHPLGGVVLIGGRAKYDNKLNTIYHLQHAGDDAQWELMPQRLQQARCFHTAFLVPDKIADYCQK